MKAGYYSKLALDGMRKNRQLYLPYLMTCAGMIAIHYILAFLSETSLLEQMPGSATMQAMLDLGVGVMEVFSVIFLFYTNSFLIRRRKMEFGLYNILGMGKGNLKRILFWETVLSALISLTAGLGIGILFSKFAELGMLNIMQGKISYAFAVSTNGLKRTCLAFCGIFFLLYLYALRQVYTASPVELLHSEHAGEKPPKANWALGILGVLVLAAAYALAISIEDPVSALVWFFAAVILVIAGTYLLFIAGSVMLCRLLQKKKDYYYHPSHFVSVSSMAYRMKRNGAGLASICILITMVLVMISSSACLYFGEEDILNSRYPRDIMVQVAFHSVSGVSDENTGMFRQELEKIAEEQEAQMNQIVDYRYAVLTGSLCEGILDTDLKSDTGLSADVYDMAAYVYFVPLSDYNRAMGTQTVLEKGQILIYAGRKAYQENSFAVQGGPVYTVKEVLADFFDLGINGLDEMHNTLFVVLPDWEENLTSILTPADSQRERLVQLCWTFGFNTPIPKEQQETIAVQISVWLRMILTMQQG